jgi:hypothetical protein
MVDEYERSAPLFYNWQLRMRPDIVLHDESMRIIKHLTAPGGLSRCFLGLRCKSISDSCAWINKGGGSDAFSFMTRSAALAYGATYKRVWRDNNCTFTVGRSCKKSIGVPDDATECLYYRQLLEFGVRTFYDEPPLGFGIVRPR